MRIVKTALNVKMAGILTLLVVNLVPTDAMARWTWIGSYNGCEVLTFTPYLSKRSAGRTYAVSHMRTNCSTSATSRLNPKMTYETHLKRARYKKNGYQNVKWHKKTISGSTTSRLRTVQRTEVKCNNSTNHWYASHTHIKLYFKNGFVGQSPRFNGGFSAKWGTEAYLPCG